MIWNVMRATMVLSASNARRCSVRWLRRARVGHEVWDWVIVNECG